MRLKSVYIYGDYPTYTGDYEVTPSFSTQTLETENKLMTDDVTVKPIVVTEVSNPQGGLTLSI